MSRNGIKMQFLGVVGFKSLTLTVYCFRSWFIHQQRETYSNLCVLCWPIHLSWFQGPKFIPPSFWPQTFLKSYFLGHCSFTQLFHDVENLSRKPKIFMKVIKKILVCTTWWLNISKNLPEAAQVATLVKFFNVKKPRHVFLIKILRYIFFNSV